MEQKNLEELYNPEENQSYFETHDKEYEHQSFTHWRSHVAYGIEKMFKSSEMRAIVSEDHIVKTPDRFIKALDEYFWGIDKDPKECLTVFDHQTENPQMIHVSGHSFYSMCAHHLAPFFGVMSFAYIPGKHIVGLSKIPRIMNIFSRRPQVQEKLTEEIVECFAELVQPLGCGLLVRARHMCMESRGVMAHGTVTTTTALRGNFYISNVKEEFLSEASRINI